MVAATVRNSKLENGDTSRFEAAWEEAVKEEENRFWRRFRRSAKRIARWAKQRTFLADREGRGRDELTKISPEAVMTKDGHILYIDPRCAKCRERFK